MKVITRTLNTMDPVVIIPLADTHIGDAHADIAAIKTIVQQIEEASNTYTILDGDLMNAAIAGSKSDTYHETMTPSDQLRACADIFGGLAKQGKILAVLPGNHEERISRVAGVDMTQLLCRELDIEDLYSPTSALVFVRFGSNIKHKSQAKMVYSIYVNHGNGGGKRIGGKANALEDMAKIVSADIFLMGHTHQPVCFRNTHYVPNPGNCTVSRREQIFVNTSSFVQYEGSYAERSGFVPSSHSVPSITLSATKHHIRVTL